MKPEPKRPRRGRRIGPAADFASPIATASVAWEDLSDEERTALKRMNRGRYPALPEDLGLRLIGLGLAVSRPGGIGISRYGRELVINTLLDPRHRD